MERQTGRETWNVLSPLPQANKQFRCFPRLPTHHPHPLPCYRYSPDDDGSDSRFWNRTVLGWWTGSAWTYWYSIAVEHVLDLLPPYYPVVTGSIVPATLPILPTLLFLGTIVL